MQSNADFIFGLCGAAAFVAVGLLLTLAPDRLQRSAQNSTTNILPLGRFLGIREFANSSRYIPALRIIGFVSIALGVFIAIGVVAARWQGNRGRW